MTFNQKLIRRLSFFVLGLIASTFSLTNYAQTDAAIIEILSPEPGGGCDGGTDISPEFVIGNVGAVPISLLFYTVTVDGIEITTTPVTGIGLGDETIITLDPIELEPGQHTITFEIGNVNGTPDNNLGNNIQSVDFEISSGLGVQLELLTDDYGQEVSFEIIDDNGEIIASIEEGTLESNAQTNYDYCLGEGCYTFNIMDAFGDGICCSFGDGYYELTNSYGQLLGTGGDYGGGESFDFCLELIILEDLDAAILSLEPEGELCSTDVSPSFTLRNDGEDNITSLLYEYSLNGMVLGEATWEGDIETFEIIDLTMPLIEGLELGNNSLEVNIVSVNGQADDNELNNIATSNFNVIEGVGFVVYLNTEDDFGFIEYNYEISDQNGDLIESIELEGSQNYEFSYCFPEGCFTILVTDDFGNGGIDFTVIANAGYTIAVSQEFTDVLPTKFCSNPPFNNDLSLNSFIFPTENNDVCGTSIAPIINVTNVGLELLTSATIEYTVGTQSGTFDWTGNLANFESENIELPELEGFNFENYEITANVVSVNGGIDENSGNDALSSSFNFIDGDEMTLTLESDNPFFLNGLGINVSDFNGNTVYQQEGFQGELNVISICASPGCYTMSFYNTYGGGAFIPLEYTLQDADGNIVFEGADVIDQGVQQQYCTSNAVTLDYDVTITEIMSTGQLCGAFVPEFTFTNLGGENVTSLTIEYNIEGEATQTYEWTGAVQQFETEEISLPAFVNLIPNDYEINISITEINGQTDEEESNNSSSASFEIINGQSLTITATTEDNPYYGGFVEYTLENEDGEVILQEGTFNAQEIQVDCLPLACYTLSAEDFFGDGNTSFVVENNLGIVLAEIEAPFGSNASVDFCIIPLDLPEIDGSVSAIIEPVNTICNPNITPTIEFFNNGLETITEIIYEYVYDGTTASEATWNGIISTYQTANIELPALSNFSSGSHELTINILSINGQEDIEIENNSLSQSFNISDAESYALYFTADIFPQDNSYQIADENDNVIFSGEQGVFSGPFTTSVEPLCLYAGCYTLSIFDEIGDGGPTVSVVNQEGISIVDGTSESSELILDFCVEGNVAGINDLPLTAAIELFPNPSTGIFYLNHQLEDNYQITVQDLLGRQVLSQQLINGQNTIDLGDNAANGIYLLSIKNGSELGVYKIMLSK